jgi:cytochrome c oxidase subunit 2
MTQLDTNSTKGKWWKRGDVRKVAIIWAILTPLIGYFGSTVQLNAMPDAASTSMENIRHLMLVFTWAAAPVAALVFAFVVHSLTSKRHYGDNPPAEADHQISNSPKANSIWLVTSAVLCLFALVAGFVALQKDDKALLDNNATVINVVGQQWVWNYDYPSSNGVRTQELHLVIHHPYVFHVTSKDVKHSFWIVQMGVKIDANPGVFTETAVTPSRLGTFDIRCAELCGLLHAYMQNKVIVQSQADYNVWLAQQGDTVLGATVPGGSKA